jgi:transcriptional regulator
MDHGFKYALVVVDDANRKLDAEPLKDKNTINLVKAFKKIYSRNILKTPKNVEFDSGAEFHGETEIYFKKLGIHIRYADVNRHRQQSLVETKNHVLGKAIHMMQAQQELRTNKQVRVWVKFLPELVSLINEHVSSTIPKHRVEDDFPVSTDDNKNLLGIGTPVRVLLDYPIHAHNEKRLDNKFRASDIRWTPTVYKITQVLLRPSFPPLYLVDDGKTTQHTRQQLQVVPAYFA